MDDADLDAEGGYSNWPLDDVEVGIEREGCRNGPSTGEGDDISVGCGVLRTGVGGDEASGSELLIV